MENPTVYYEGDFKDDQLHGYGVEYSWKGSKIYEGHWVNGKHHGHGKRPMEFYGMKETFRTISLMVMEKSIINLVNFVTKDHLMKCNTLEKGKSIMKMAI